ncbi:hypothetical protein EB077_03395 [bacterium]|nr:hypothetical protein [bacterium]
MYLDFISRISQNINRRSVLIVVSILVVFLSLVWVSNYSFITLSSASETTVNVYKQGGEYDRTTKITNGKLKLLVPKGSYELTFRASDSSHYSIVKTKGFLTNVLFTAELKPENSRSFIGGNAGPCAYYTGDILLSSKCEGNRELKLHVPATASTPTYTTTQLPTKDGTALFGTIEGVHTTETETLVLTKVSAEDEEFGYHSLFSIDNANGTIRLRPTNSKPSASFDAHEPSAIFTGLASDATYSMSSYKNGFLLSEKYPKSVIYYETSTLANPKTIILNPPKEKVDPNSAYLSSYSDSIAVYYSAKNGGSKSELVYVNNSTKHFVFSRSFDKAYLCGNFTLCAFKKETLFLYNLTGNKPAELGVLERVNYAERLGNSILVINKSGAILFDPQTKNGHIAYSLDGYSFDSAQTYKNNFIVSVRGNKTGKIAMLIDTTLIDDTNKVDKKLLELSKSNEIESISPYGKYVYIVPSLGEIAYNESTNSFDYSSEKRLATNTSINQAVTSLGVDKSKFVFINTNP